MECVELRQRQFLQTMRDFSKGNSAGVSIRIHHTIRTILSLLSLINFFLFFQQYCPPCWMTQGVLESLTSLYGVHVMTMFDPAFNVGTMNAMCNLLGQADCTVTDVLCFKTRLSNLLPEVYEPLRDEEGKEVRQKVKIAGGGKTSTFTGRFYRRIIPFVENDAFKIDKQIAEAIKLADHDEQLSSRRDDVNHSLQRLFLLFFLLPLHLLL
jgi:hypothetical protein